MHFRKSDFFAPFLLSLLEAGYELNAFKPLVS